MNRISHTLKYPLHPISHNPSGVDYTVRNLTLGIIGAGGDGVITIGELLTSSAAHEGLHVMNTKSYGPQIRGGEAATMVRFSECPVLSQGDSLDVLVAFNWRDFGRFAGELIVRPDTVVLHDPHDRNDPPPEIAAQGRHLYQVPFEQLARDTAGTSLAKNIICIGLLGALFNLPLNHTRAALERKFARKGPKVVEANRKALMAGETFVHEIARSDDVRLDWERDEMQLVLTGNDAVSYGALYAGCRFFAGYPITPASEILGWMSRQLPRYGGYAIQPEDEIAAIGMVVGASFAGVKAMTATSGPGFALMSEMLGLASIMELPLVVVNVQRVGPSTGIPTKTEQADLDIALHGTHGDSPRVVLAPTTMATSFAAGIQAFYIAEKYQLPVIILTDQFLAARKDTIPRERLTRHKDFDKIARRLPPTPRQLAQYQRYSPAPDGVSPMSHPGMARGMYHATGLEHTTQGYPTSNGEKHQQMSHKRCTKLEAIARDLKFHRRHGSGEARVGVVTWGSSEGAVREAIEQLTAEGYAISIFVPVLLRPLPVDELQVYLDGLDQLVVVEMSYAGQFMHHLRAYIQLPARTAHYKRAGGRPFTVTEIREQLLPLVNPRTARPRQPESGP